MSHPIIILGASGHGAVVAEAAAAAGMEVLGHVADKPSTFGLLGDESALPRLLDMHRDARLFVAIGDNFTRRHVVRRIQADIPDVAFATVIHPSAIVAGGVVGPGAFVAAGAVVGVGAKVGAFAIVNTRASLDHHSTLGDYASMAPASATGGNAHIGEGTAIGMGVMIHHGTKVGDWTVVGSSSLVNKDLPGGVVACGQPARVLRERKFDEPYL